MNRCYIVKQLKIHLILPLMVILLLLSGCIRIDIDTGIDSNYTAYISYNISLDISDIDPIYQNEITRAMHRIGWHYQEYLGFTVGVNTEEFPVTLSMTRRIENKNLEQAFDSLKELLSDEDSTIFMQVDMAFQGFERQERYMISAMADIPQVLRLSNAEDLTSSLHQVFTEGIQEGTGSITLTLPADELISSTHRASIQYNRATMEVPLNFMEQTSFDLAAFINILNDGTRGGIYREIIQELNQYRFIAFIVCCIAVLILLIALLVIIGNVRSKKKHRSRRTIDME